MAKKEEPFTYIEKFDTQIDKELEEWILFLDLYVMGDDPDDMELTEALILYALRDDSTRSPSNFRGIRDNEGNLQVAAYVSEQIKQPSHISLDLIATAPWRRPHRGNDPRGSKLREAGRLMLKQIVRESMEKGYRGRIELCWSDSTAKEFYLEAGLTQYEKGKMVLTAKAANKFLCS